MAQARQGYHLLADFMSWASDTAIFPRFKSSNVLNLLLLQAEISKLEEDLRDFVDLDQKSGQPSRVNASLDWEALCDLEEDHPTKKTLEELREKLSVYNQALIQQITLNRQRTPSYENLDILRGWLRDTQGGKSELRGPGAMTWSEVPDGGRAVEDLLGLSSSRQERTVVHAFLRALFLLLKRFARSEAFSGRDSSKIVAEK